MDQHQHPSTTTFAMELTGKIMVAAIFILFLVVVFVLILQLYSRWLLSRIDDSAARRSDHESPVSTLRKGLDAAVLRSIPTVVFSAEDFNDVLECAVCLSELEEGEKARLLPMCNHGFHVDCIDMWLDSNSTCPLCRNPVAPSSSNPSELKDLESPIFPTNVLFWGNQMQISSLGVCLEEPQTSSSSSSSSTNIRTDGMLVVDIPNDPSSSSSGAGAGECSGHEEMKSAVTNRLRTLKRLLSRERSICSNSNSLDLEQVGRVQSSMN